MQSITPCSEKLNHHLKLPPHSVSRRSIDGLLIRAWRFVIGKKGDLFCLWAIIICGLYVLYLAVMAAVYWLAVKP